MSEKKEGLNCANASEEFFHLENKFSQKHKGNWKILERTNEASSS